MSAVSPAAGTAGAAGGDRRLGRSQRITRSPVFQETYGQGRRWVGRNMVLWLRTGPDAALRLGVVSSRRIGNAVIRNRARRRLREVFRLNRDRLTGSVDVVLVARGPCAGAPWSELTGEFLRLAERAGLCQNDGKREQMS